MEAISAAAMAATGCEENQDSGSGYASGPGAHQKLFVVREEKVLLPLIITQPRRFE